MTSFRSRIASILLAATLVAVPAIASAQLTPGNTGLQSAAQGSGLTGGCSSAGCIADVIGRAINIVLGFLGIVLLILFLYAGFLWMTAGGDEEQVKKAKQFIMNAIIGYFVIGVAYALTGFVLDSLARVTTNPAESGPAETTTASEAGG